MKRCISKGFTLIELLVVIAIIAILAAILFPVFAKARDKARQSVCMNNMKQIGMAFAQYMSDNDGGFPEGGHYTPSNAYEAGTHVRALMPYTKNDKIWECPVSVATTPAWRWSANDYGWNYSNAVTQAKATYAYNANWNIAHGIWPYGWSFQEGAGLYQFNEYATNGARFDHSITSPAETLVLVDGNGSDIAAYQPAYGGEIQVDYPHFDTSMVLFADWHVKATKRSIPPRYFHCRYDETFQ